MYEKYIVHLSVECRFVVVVVARSHILFLMYTHMYTMYLCKNMFLWCLYFSHRFCLAFFFMLVLIKCRWTFYLHILVVFIINVRNGYSDTIGKSGCRCRGCRWRRCRRRRHMWSIRRWSVCGDGVGMCVSVPHIHIKAGRAYGIASIR